MASTTVQDIPDRLAPAYRECIALARSHYENFTVAGRFLPKRLLPPRRRNLRLLPRRRRPWRRGSRRPTRALGRMGSGPRTGLRGHADCAAPAGAPAHHPRFRHPTRALPQAHHGQPDGPNPEPLRHLRRRPPLLRALRQPRRLPLPPTLRLRRRGAPPAVGRHVHGAAASQLLAGRASRLGQGPRLPAAGGHGALRLHGGGARRGRLQPGLSRSNGLGGGAGTSPLRAGAAPRGDRWKARRGCTSSSSASAACVCWTPFGRKATMSSQSGRWSPDAARYGSWRRRTSV